MATVPPSVKSSPGAPDWQESAAQPLRRSRTLVRGSMASQWTPPNRGLPHAPATAPAGGRRRWSEAERAKVCAQLQTDGNIDAADVELSAEEVERLMGAAIWVDGRAHFGRAAFVGARFGNGASFRGAIFGDRANFRGAIFGDRVDFRGAIFGADASFEDHASFGQGANFRGAIFGDRVNFRSATFGAEASFEDRATFHDYACFDHANFGDGSSFAGATFGHEAGFAGAIFGKRASFIGAIFGDDAFFGGGVFGEGALISGVTFGDRATFRGAALEAASLAGTSMAGSSLNRARFDYRSSLEGARLFTFVDGGGGIRTRAPWLGDVRWNGVQVSGVADWGYAKKARLGDDPDVHPVESFYPEVSQSVDADIRTEALNAAVRAYRQVSTLVDDEGMREVAQELDYRASQLVRRQQHGLAKFLLWVLDRLTGYGYRPGRILTTYLVAVATFAVIYGWTGTTSWENAPFASLLAFHGRGISASDIVMGRLDVIVPSIEAAVGLFVEALVVAVIIRRLFRS
jgi:uncharacterized protein YjbI with pentapeptide repeats